MAFPETPLGTFVELYLGGTWVDTAAAGHVRSTDGTSAIDIQRGITSSGGGVADRGTCSLTLDNRDGRYSARNPRSPYYGQLTRNTPLRAGVLMDTPWLAVPYDTTVTATTPDNAALHITGDLDVRVDLELASWVDINTATVTGRWDGASNCSWALTMVEGSVVLWWTTDGTTDTERGVFSDPIPVTPGWGRVCVRTALDVDNGAGAHTVTFYTAPSMSGPWTQVGDPASDITVPGPTSVFAGTHALEVGTVTGNWTGVIPPSTARIYAVQVLSGIGGTVVASPDFTAQAVGATSWTDSAGRVWAAPADSVTNRLERFTGEVSSWPPTWDTGAFDITVPITASGILQRLGQGQTPLASALRRSTAADPGLRAYWPMEDAAGATQAAAALPMGAPLRLVGVNFAADSSLAGSAALPQLAGAATMSGSAPAGTAGDWGVGMLVNMSSVPATLETLLTISCSGGACAQVQVLVDVATVRIQTVALDGTVLSSADATPAGITGWVLLTIRTLSSGGSISYNMNLGDTPVVTTLSGSAGSVSSVGAAWSADFAGMSIGHLTVGSPTSVPLMAAAEGNVGYDAPDRIYRTANDAGIPMSVIGVEDDSETLGVEPQDTALAVIKDAAKADEGLLYEAREFVGLRYRNLTSLYNQPSALDLPYTASPQPLLTPLGPPTDDDQMLRNTSTITRTNGSSATYTQTEGPYTPAAVGTYPDTDTLNVEADGRAIQHAAWRVHVGTWDEARYPSVTIELAKDPSLAAAVSRIDTGSRIRITGTLPAFLPPGPIDLLVLGYQETIAQFSWRITFACVPYGPYQLGVMGDPVYCRVDTAGCQLATGVTASATSWSVTTTVGARWVDSAGYPAEFPFDWMVGGERVTVTAISGTGTTQTATVTRSVNGISKAQSAGTGVRLADPTYVAL